MAKQDAVFGVCGSVGQLGFALFLTGKPGTGGKTAKRRKVCSGVSSYQLGMLFSKCFNFKVQFIRNGKNILQVFACFGHKH